MNNLFKEGKIVEEAIKEGVANRFRPILITAIVAILALFPMALGYETGGEANVPLARAIIGGVTAATFLSLFVVPILFYLFNKKSQIKMKPIQSIIIIIPLVLMLFSSCGNNNVKKETATENRNVPTVLVSNPETHQFDASLQISGIAKPNQQVKIFAMTNGFLKKLKVDIGDFVKKGQILSVLENPELFSEKLKLEAELKGKKSLYGRLKNSPSQTSIGSLLEEKKALYERLQSIYEKTPQLTTITDVQKAKADYYNIKAQLVESNDNTLSGFESTKAQLGAINTQISFLTVKAPFTGIIFNRFADKGALIQNGLTNSNAMPLFEIQDVQLIRLTIDVPETDATLISKGTKAAITFPEMPDLKFSVTVSRIAYGLNENTKTMKVEIDLPNSNLKIRSGMYAKVEIQRSGHKDALSVPNEAVGNIKGQSFVYVIENGTARKVEVKTGIRDEKFTELLSGEIKTTNKIVVQGKEFCSNGATVQTKELTTK